MVRTRTTCTILMETVGDNNKILTHEFKNAIITEFNISGGDRDVEMYKFGNAIDKISPMSNYEGNLSFTLSPMDANGNSNFISALVSTPRDEYKKYNTQKIKRTVVKTSDDEFKELAEMINNEQ